MAAIEESDRFAPRFDERGLMPCVAVDHESGAILMLAYVDREAIERTLQTGYAHYFSRSRNALWKKGETSGALQAVREVRTDCDQDAMVYRVSSQRRDATCHTGRPTCFYRIVEPGTGGDAAEPALRFDPPENEGS